MIFDHILCDLAFPAKSQKETLMTEKKRNALIPLPAGGLTKIGRGPKSILSGMVSDALALVRAREKALAAARFRIGDYEFRDPDYRQILIWAKALGIEPSVFVNTLNNYLTERDDWEHKFYAALEVEDGSILTLGWDFDCFPISSFEWVDGLRIERLWFRNSASTKILLRLPLLNLLKCSDCGLTELDLSAVPALTELMCDGNQLVELNLSAVPALTELTCDGNQLVELNLSAVPALTHLWCGDNQLIELDLSTVPRLTSLKCGGNQFVELDLSAVPALTYLECDGNQLIELDLSSVPRLTSLICGGNQFVELDLSAVPALTHLECDGNQLLELDLSKVPALDWLKCENNQLLELDLRGLGQVLVVECDPSVTLKKLPTQDF